MMHMGSEGLCGLKQAAKQFGSKWLRRYKWVIMVVYRKLPAMAVITCFWAKLKTALAAEPFSSCAYFY